MIRKEWIIEYFDYEKGDVNELLSLFNTEYGPVDPSKPEYFKWYCLDNPAGRAIVTTALDPDTSKLVGEWWLIPQRTKFPGGERVGSVGMNALVAREYRGLGIINSLGNSPENPILEQGVDFTMAFPNRHLNFVFKVSIKLNEWASAGLLGLYALPLDPELFEHTRLRKYPFASRIIKTISGLTWPLLFSPRKIKHPNAKISIVEKTGFDDQFTLFWNKVKDKYPLWFVRDASFLTWRYIENPCRQYNILVAMKHEEMIGYLILRRGIIRKFPVGAIVDLVVEPTERGDLAAQLLVREAVMRFRKEKLSLSVCVMRPRAQEEKAIKHQGYRQIPKAISPQKVDMSIKTFSEDCPRELIYNVNNWYVTLGDFDIV